LRRQLTSRFETNHLQNSIHTKQEEKPVTVSDWWNHVDKNLETAIDNYESIVQSPTSGDCDISTPIFIDLIIKLLICRAYVNNVNKKPLTAHRLLEEAEALMMAKRLE